MTGRRAPTWLTFANRVNRPLLRRGFGPRPQHLLVVAGRKSGVVRATPVAILEQAGARYLVAGFDGADWIKNVRHQGGRAVLQRGARREHVMLLELPVGERAPILRAFARTVRGPGLRHGRTGCARPRLCHRKPAASGLQDRRSS